MSGNSGLVEVFCGCCYSVKLKYCIYYFHVYCTFLETCMAGLPQASIQTFLSPTCLISQTRSEPGFEEVLSKIELMEFGY